MRQTSLLAFREIKPKRHTAHEAIINLLEITVRPPTNSEIAKSLGWSINRVTPRVNELVKLGQVEDGGKKPCSITGRIVHCWRLT